MHTKDRGTVINIYTNC